MAAPSLDVKGLAARVLGRERVAIAEALNLTEDRRAPSRAALAELLALLRASGKVDRAHRVGITGPPGVGKSTLVSALVARSGVAPRRRPWRPGGGPFERVLGGALLGDRMRIAPDPGDAGSSSARWPRRGSKGGSRGASRWRARLSAAFDVTLVETVGSGRPRRTWPTWSTRPRSSCSPDRATLCSF